MTAGSPSDNGMHINYRKMGGKMLRSIGRAFSVSCSCKLIVCVDTTAFFLFATAWRIAGTR